MNYDKFEPVSQPESGGYYSTGRPAKSRQHSGLVVVLSVLLVLGCAGATIANLFDVSVDREPGRTSLTLTDKNTVVSATRVMSTSMNEVVGISNVESDAAVLQITPPPLRTEAEKTLPEIYEKNIPSVVSIQTISQYGYDSKTCCGIIMSPDGYIITDYTTISGGRVITVFVGEDAEYEATVVGTDESTNLAVIKIDAKNLKAAEFGEADQLSVGEEVVCISDPLGSELHGTMTDGIICGINKDLNLIDRTMTILLTNAAPSIGAFGSPLINHDGQVIGINVHSIGDYSDETVDGLSFALPIDDVKTVVDELIKFGAIPGRPSIDFSGQAVPKAVQNYYKLPEGVYVDNIVPGGAADLAGIRPGDIITAFNGTEVSSFDDLNQCKNSYSSGDQVTLRIFRSNVTMDITLILGES